MVRPIYVLYTYMSEYIKIKCIIHVIMKKSYDDSISTRHQLTIRGSLGHCYLSHDASITLFKKAKILATDDCPKYTSIPFCSFVRQTNNSGPSMAASYQKSSSEQSFQLSLLYPFAPTLVDSPRQISDTRLKKFQRRHIP